MIVENGRKVSFDYVLTVDGEVVDKSSPEQPFQYIHGEGQIIPGLAKGLEGMSVGEEKEIRLPPQEAYGLPDPRAFYEISSNSLPKDKLLEQSVRTAVAILTEGVLVAPTEGISKILIHPDNYVNWILPLFSEMYRVIKPTGSIIFNIYNTAIDKEKILINSRGDFS